LNNENEKNSLKNILGKIKGVVKKIPKTINKVIIIVIILGIVYLGITTSSTFKSQTKTTKLGFEDVGELVTQTAYLTNVKDNKEDRKFFDLFKIPFTESRQIFSYDIQVDASVDFSKVSYVRNDKKSEITIRLPHSKIYKATLDLNSLKVYLDEESIFTRIDLKEENDSLKTMKEECIEDAKANGLLEKADENAKRLIEGFIKSDNKLKDYKVIYKYIGD